MSAPGRIVVVGDVVNDVLVRPLGPVTPDSDTRAQIVRRPGGSAANLASWLGSLGAPVSFVGRVGANDGAYHADHLGGFGVEPHLTVDPERETGTIVVVLDGAGRRTMLVDRAANLALTAADVPPGLLEQASVLHLTGYSFFESGVRAAALDLLARARALRVPVSVDPSSVAFLRDVGAEQFLSWTSGARFCFPNRDEAAALAGTSDPLRAAERLTDHYGTVVVTLDGDGCVVAGPGSRPVAVPTQRLVAVDPTGAGDAFCAGFLDAWSRGLEPVDAAVAGSLVARRAVGRLGGRP
jgi:sugar/nucleoside kinase (ribokinase family)